MRALLLAFSAWCCLSANALTVNRLNGSASVIYIDFVIPSTIPMELARTYNSITATNEQRGWLGAFGWGWTSPFETTMTTTPDRNVLLRDGANGNTVLFRPEKEDPKAMSEFLEAFKIAYFNKERGLNLSKSEAAKLNLPERIATSLRTDPQFRNEMAAKYAVKATIPTGQVLVSSEFGYQTVYQKGTQWIRTRDGMTQTFDGDGRLIQQRDAKGALFTFTYSPTQKYQLDEVRDANKTASLKFTWRGDRIAEVTDNRGNRAVYTYDATGNLTQVVDSDRQTFRYAYENKKYPHLITKIDYVTESKQKPSYRQVRYDDNALVVYHREKDGTETHYTYGKIARDPENNFWTKTVVNTRGGKEETYDEYLIKARPDGTKYLYRQEHKDATETTITVYNPCCGQPLEVTKNGVVTSFKYYPDGLLKERVSPSEAVAFEYHPKWKKATQVKLNATTYKYSYDGTGTLTRAENDKKEFVVLKYRKGKISEMTGGPDKTLLFDWGSLGRPVLITQPGVGAIRLHYDAQGRVDGTEIVPDARGRKPSRDDSKDIGRRVMKSFQLLLDLLRPAGAGVNFG